MIRGGGVGGWGEGERERERAKTILLLPPHSLTYTHTHKTSSVNLTFCILTFVTAVTICDHDLVWQKISNTWHENSACNRLVSVMITFACALIKTASIKEIITLVLTN